MVRVVRDPRQGRSSWDCGPEAGRTGQIRGPHKLSQASWRFWDEMVGRHHRLNGPEFEQALGDGDGQGSLVCCSPWGRKELDTTALVDREPSKEVNHPTQSRAALTELSLENLRKYPNSDLGLKCVSEPRWYTELC